MRVSLQLTVSTCACHQTAEAAARRAERQQVKQLLVGLFPTVNADQLDVVREPPAEHRSSSSLVPC